MNPSVILISSSSDDDDGSLEEEEDDEDELESEFSSEDDSDSDYSESDDQEYNEEEENDVESDEEESLKYCDEFRDRVVHSNQGTNGVHGLSFNECKAYLRKHGLRLSGTKEECMHRMKEHGRLKDGRGESLYPRASFSINCTGDACKGDVVLFRQRVYNKFDKASRRGDVIGKRTIAGRIVKESYGASKQQHTFTVEVLWSKGPMKLPPLSSLLVKGRNLYRLGTFRQPWKNEAERSKVLGEKHARGEAARHKRKLRKTDIAPNNDKGTKRQKLSHRGPSGRKQPTKTDKQKSVNRRGAASSNKNKTCNKRKAVPSQKPTPSRSRQPDPNCYLYSDHQLHMHTSSSFPNDRIPFLHLPPPSFRFSSYDHYPNGQLHANHVPYQPPGPAYYEQPFPRYRLG